MKPKNALHLLVLSWLASALAIIGIAFIIAPDTYVDGFWGRVAWTEFLNILFWWGNSGWFIENKKNANAALTPAIGYVTSIYCVVSFVVMLAFYDYESTAGLSKVHGVIQTVLFCVYALIMLRFQMAAHFANKDMIVADDAGMSVAELAGQIKSVEGDYPADIAAAVKKLREKIEYSLQDNNRVRTNEKYKKVASEIIEHLDSFSLDDVKRFIRDIDAVKQGTKRS